MIESQHTHLQSSLPSPLSAERLPFSAISYPGQFVLEHLYTPRILTNEICTKNDGQSKVKGLPSSPSPSSSSSLMSRLSGCGPFGPSSNFATESEMKSSSPVVCVCRSRPRFSLATLIDDSEGIYDVDSSVFFFVIVSVRRHQ